MALHVSGKLCALGLIIASLLTAFSLPKKDGVPLAVMPTVTVLATPREAPTSPQTYGPITNLTFELRATGYNSLQGQTDGSPHITATGERTRFGIVAVSRDLLGDSIPYGSLVRIHDLGNYYSGRGYGHYEGLLDSQELFIVEDTMHARKRQQIDVWFGDYASAVNWGVRRVEVEVIRFGRTGPIIHSGSAPFDGIPQLAGLALGPAPPQIEYHPAPR